MDAQPVTFWSEGSRVAGLWQTPSSGGAHSAVVHGPGRFGSKDAVVSERCHRYLTDAGFGEYFIHRTGHSIDTDLHGSGPNLDNLESRDDRLRLPGVAFSVEPGIYILDDIGIRSELNVHWGAAGPEVTPSEIQSEIFVLLDD